MQRCATAAVEGATATSIVSEPSPCSPLGLSSTHSAIGLFCWLMFELAVYALLFSSQ
jgi:hypothetical protein